MNSEPQISIIIRTFNEEKLIGKLLDAVYSQQINHPFEVVVIDSGSRDRTLEILRKYPVRMAYITPEQFSFGRSLNWGIKASRGKYLVLISAHCWPKKNSWLKHMVEPLMRDSGIAIVYGKQRGNELTKFSEHQVFAKQFPDKSQLMDKVPFCNNANSAITREIWEKFPYDEELTGLEDMDLAKKVLNAGKKIYYSAEAEIVHVHEETPKKTFIRYHREALALKNIFPRATFTFTDFFKLFVSNIALDYLRALKNDRRLKHIWEIPIFRLMQFWGTYKGYNKRDGLTDELKKHLYYPKT
jgi:glycosyltransferase involved in cell wall biosynthesis